MEAEFSAALLNRQARLPQDLAHWNQGETSRRFQVYRNNFSVSLIDALQDTFPVCCALTGVDFFRALAREYVFQQPPDSPILVHYGHQFADFIDAFEPARALPYLADVARLERLWLDSYHSADVQPMPVDSLASWLKQPEKLQRARLMLAPACQWLGSDFPVLSIWQAHQPASGIELGNLPLERAETLLLTRPGLQVNLHSVEPDAAVFLTRLQQGFIFSAAIADLNFDLVALLQVLVQQGALVDFSTD